MNVQKPSVHVVSVHIDFFEGGAVGLSTSDQKCTDLLVSSCARNDLSKKPIHHYASVHNSRGMILRGSVHRSQCSDGAIKRTRLRESLHRTCTNRTHSRYCYHFHRPWVTLTIADFKDTLYIDAENRAVPLQATVLLTRDIWDWGREQLKWKYRTRKCRTKSTD